MHYIVKLLHFTVQVIIASCGKISGKLLGLSTPTELGMEKM